MAGLLSTQGTSEMHWEPDTSLIDEQAETERALLPSIVSGFRRGRPTHHQASAGHGPGLMSRDYTCIDAGALAEVIRVDYHPFF